MVYQSIDNDYESGLKKSIESSEEEILEKNANKCLNRKIFAYLGVIIIFTTLLFHYNPFSSSYTVNELGLMNVGVVNSLQKSFKQINHPLSPNTMLWGIVTKPYPTGAFWTNLVLKSGEGAVGVQPYGIKCTNKGISVSYGPTRRVVTNIAITDTFDNDWVITASQNYESRGIASYDKISVAMSYKLSANGRMTTHLVKGSPFVTVTYENATPLLKSSTMHILSVDARVVEGSLGVQYVVKLGNFQTWLVYCSQPVALVWKDDTLYSPTTITGFIRIAILPNQNAENSFSSLLQYVGKYPIGVTIDTVSNTGNTAIEQYTFKTIGTGELLMLALPHHVDVLQQDGNAAINEALRHTYTPIYTIKGYMSVVVGEVWKLQYNLVQPDWNYKAVDQLSINQLNKIAAALQSDVMVDIPEIPDPYGLGKKIGRMARLALIADDLGIADVREKAVASLESTLTPWLLGNNNNALLYDKTWGGIVTTNGVADPLADYGNGYYNDHHFHYGYFIYAGATLARLDINYFNTHRPAFEEIVNDIFNIDSSNTDYPYIRHKDSYEGHSWASGLFEQANGKNQESSSESCNAYYSVYLYAQTLGLTEMMKKAQIVLTTEVLATKKYWHIHGNSDIYDSVFSSRRMAASIGALDVTSSTWFGKNIEYLHGIQMLPVTPLSTILYGQSFVIDEWTVVGSVLKPDDVEPMIDENNSDTDSNSNSNSSGSGSIAKECSAYAACTKLGLTGNCCPSDEGGATLSCCSDNVSDSDSDGMIDEWKALIYAIEAVVDRVSAWNGLMKITETNFGSGNSKANSLYWAASRSGPPPGWDSLSVIKSPGNYTGFIDKRCNANSACDASGLLGDCCPGSNGIMLGCCPKILDD